MGFIALTIVNLKILLKKRITIFIGFILPILLSIGFGLYFNNQNKDSIEKYYVVNLDTSENENIKMLINELKKQYSINIKSKKEADEDLINKKIDTYYEIKNDFSNLIEKSIKPKIVVNTVKKREAFDDFENTVNILIDRIILKNEIKINTGKIINLDRIGSDIKVDTSGSKNNFGSAFTISVILSFLMYNSLSISLDLFHIRKQRVLRRSFTTERKPSVIIASIFAAHFVMIFVGYSLMLILNVYINARDMVDRIPIMIINTLALTIVITSLSVLVNRLFKNESYISMFLQTVVGISCFVGGMFIPTQLLPENITILSKFTPQYWSMQSITYNRYDYVIVVLLFAIVMFTAGNLSTKIFINKTE